MDVPVRPRMTSKMLLDFFSNHPDALGSFAPMDSQGRSSSSAAAAAEDKIAWLQSQIIGGSKEFDTPFGTRRLTYADHTASGRCLRYVEDYIVQELLPFYGNTHTDDSFLGSKTTRMVHKASAYVKRCMGAGPDDAILFCGSGSSAAIKRLQEVMGIAVPSIMRERLVGCLRDEERWVVFIGPYEHHSNYLSWQQTTAEVVEIGLDAGGHIDMEELDLRLASPRYANRPMLGSFSACSNVTGILTDTRAVARLLHQHGAFACFDFAASGPYVEIDMRSGDLEGYDAVFLSPHKFIGGPGTPGILLMNTALYQLSSSPPSTCGGGTVNYVNGVKEDTLYHEEIEEREDCGTPGIIQKVRAALAFWVKEYIGHGFIDRRELFYAEAAMGRLLRIPNLMVLGDVKAKRLPIISFIVFPPTPQDSSGTDVGGIVEELENRGETGESAELTWSGSRPLHGRFVTKLLNDLFGIQARGGCSCAGPYGHSLLAMGGALSLRIRDAIHKGYIGVKPGWTRVSFTYYTTKEEFAFILDAIEFVAAYGHRFLPLYQCDWRSGDWSIPRSARKNQRDVVMQEAELNADLASPHMILQAAAGGEFGVKGNRRSTPNSKGGGVGVAGKYKGYLETAKRIALSLPEHPISAVPPPEIDLSAVLFKL